LGLIESISTDLARGEKRPAERGKALIKTNLFGKQKIKNTEKEREEEGKGDRKSF